jgi:hypothetical protein
MNFFTVQITVCCHPPKNDLEILTGMLPLKPITVLIGKDKVGEYFSESVAHTPHFQVLSVRMYLSLRYVVKAIFWLMAFLLRIT